MFTALPVLEPAGTRVGGVDQPGQLGVVTHRLLPAELYGRTEEAQAELPIPPPGDRDAPWQASPSPG